MMLQPDPRFEAIVADYGTKRVGDMEAGVPWFDPQRVEDGLAAERHAAFFLDLPLVEDHGARYDLQGGPYKVRSSKVPDQFPVIPKRELVYPGHAEPPNPLLPTDIVIVVVTGGLRYRVRGWTTGAVVLARGHYERVGDYPILWWVRNSVLSSIDTLPRWAVAA